MNPKYPLYIISKGRSEHCLTAKHLDLLGVNSRIVIEPCDYEDYCKYFDKERILVLPFENLGQGSIPARNWVWDHSKQHGDKRHWILDDNIYGFYRMTHNAKIKVADATIFRCAEDFVDRYINVPIAGLNYQDFCIASNRHPPFYLNTRVYSCLLIENEADYRWRGRYNEDTDLSLRVLKDGLCTILFNAFLIGKTTTMQMKGGNTDNVYVDEDNRRKFAESLQKQHPDIVDVVWKFNRWHHQVNYKPFKRNQLIRKPGLEIKQGINNYGMRLEDKL